MLDKRTRRKKKRKGRYMRRKVMRRIRLKRRVGEWVILDGGRGVVGLRKRGSGARGGGGRRRGMLTLIR
jgi:hypothetical protein